MSLADILERAATALPEDADAIRPANGDPVQLLTLLGPAAGPRVLGWLLTNEPDGGAQLALAWADDEAGVELLSQIDESQLPKLGRKAIRKALHRLRSRGLDLPNRREHDPVVARLPQLDDDVGAGYVCAIDPRGTRVVYLVESVPAGGARLFELLLDDQRGVVDFEVYTSGRSRIRAFVKQMLARSKFPAVEAPVEALRALIARIAEAHPADRALPQRFSEYRLQLAVPGMTPGELAAEALTDCDDADGLERAAELVKKGTLGPWGPPAPQLAKRIEGWLEDEAKRDLGSPDWGAIAARVLFTVDGDARAAAQRFRETAYLLWKQERERDATACLAAARRFLEPDPLDNPLAAAMAEALLAPVIASLGDRAEAEAES